MIGILFFSSALFLCPAPLALLLAVLLHESGHLVCARLLGWGRPAVSIGPAGIRLRYGGIHPIWEEVLVFAAGSGTNLAAAAFCRGGSFSFYCVGLALINLLPIAGLDGGGILQGICSMLCRPDRAFLLCRIISSVCVLALWVLNIYIQMKVGFHLTLLAVSLYLTVTVLGGKA